VIAVFMLFVKGFVFLVLVFFILFFVCGLVLYFLVIPLLMMTYTDMGYQLPTLDRLIMHGKFMVLASPICAAVVALFLRS